MTQDSRVEETAVDEQEGDGYLASIISGIHDPVESRGEGVISKFPGR